MQRGDIVPEGTVNGSGPVAMPAVDKAPPLGLEMPLSRSRGLRFRSIETDDLTFLGALYASTREDEVARVPWSDQQRRDFLLMQFDAQHRHYVEHYPDASFTVIEEGSESIGRLYLDEWKDEFRLIDIALMPAARGRGLGSAVLQDLLLAAESRAKAVRIHVEKNNPAMRLYVRLGFERAEDKGVYDLLEWKAPIRPGTSGPRRPQ